MDLYTSIVFVTIAFLAVVVCDTFTSRIVSKKLKNDSILVCCLVAAATICEWVGVKTNCAGSSYVALHKAVKLLEFSIAPCIGVAAAFGYGYSEHRKVAVGILIAHALFEAVALHFGWVIIVDGDSVYRHGNLYFIYLIFLFASSVYCFVCLVRKELLHYNRIDLVPYVTLVFVVMGVVVQIIWSLRIDYLCIAMGNYLLYNHRCKMILQLDGLTRLLNRRCFEKDVEKLKAPAVIVSMDVNDFKALNDNYGHGSGDICLKELGKVIFNVFGKYWYCYRYGGDEFCIILKRRLDDTKQLCEEFEKAVEEMKSKVVHSSDVAVGYARFDKNEDVKDSLAKADEMMYKVKNQMKNRE